MKTKLISFLVVAIVAVQSYAKDPVLKTAIWSQDLPKLKELLNGGADVNEKSTGSPQIYWTVVMGNVDMIKLMVEKGAKIDDPSQFGWTPLAGLIDGADEPAKLLENNKKVNAMLIKRVKGDTAKVAQWLAHEDIKRFSPVADKIKCVLELGADPNYVLGNGAVKLGTPFLWAVKAGKLDFVKIMLDTKKVDTEYRFDSYAEKSIKVSNKLGAGRYGDANTEKEWAEISMFNTPLLYAIEKGNLELVKILIEGGADINNGKKYEWNESNTQIKTHHWEYWTPLDIAQKAKNPNKEIIDYLISKGGVANRK